MSLTIVAPPELEARLRAEAERQGVDTNSYALSLLEAAAPAKAGQTLTTQEYEAARNELLKYAGCFDSGDPHSADNDRIDADLAAEYGRGLDRRA